MRFSLRTSYGLAVAIATLLALPAFASAYPVLCNDGTTSDAGGKQGACSHHGGVAGGSGAPSMPTPPTPVPPIPAPPTPAPPTDLLSPTITVTEATLPATAVGRPVQPPAITVTDDVAWPAGPYSVAVNWGDGTPEPVSFAGVPAAYSPVTVTLPPHVYAASGRFDITVTVSDPAGHATTKPVSSATIEAPIETTPGYPRIVGTPKVGRLLTCDAGPWRGAASLSYRWRVAGQLIPNVAGRTFRVRARDAGRRLACQVTARNDVSTVTTKSKAITIRRAARRDTGS